MSKNSEKNSEKNKRIRQYAKYSGLPFQLFGLIALFGFIGYKLDTYFQNPKYYITACLILLAFTVFMYGLFVTINKDK